MSEVFRRHFSHLGNVDVVSALSKMRDFGNTMKFTGRFYDNLMKAFHEAIVDTQCMNTNCFDLINKDKTSNLYYVDPPYVDTSGYDEDGYGEFTTADMKQLIEELTKIKGKFIYSCRAVDSPDGGVKKIDSNKKLEKTKRANRNIREFVFDVFDKNCQSDIYVLAIEDFTQKDKKLEKTLAQRIKNCEVIELMITNYEIHSFMDIRYYTQYPPVIFRVYTLQEFLKIWDQNALV